jgi:hypothetical protein
MYSAIARSPHLPRLSLVRTCEPVASPRPHSHHRAPGCRSRRLPALPIVPSGHSLRVFALACPHVTNPLDLLSHARSLIHTRHTQSSSSHETHTHTHKTTHKAHHTGSAERSLCAPLSYMRASPRASTTHCHPLAASNAASSECEACLAPSEAHDVGRSLGKCLLWSLASLTSCTCAELAKIGGGWPARA